MEEKIEKLIEIKEDIEVMIHILEGKLSKESLRDAGAIVDMIDCYKNEGEYFKAVFNAIIKEHGDEPCPFNPKDMPKFE
jgi:hypothetical protein